MAWIALANRQREQGRAGFEHVLALDPNNDEARIGLTKVDDVYRNVVETSGTLVSTSLGTSWGFGARGQFGITAFDTVELGLIHYTEELRTVTAVGVAVLPSNDVTLGYHRLVPLRYAVSLIYDYRAHTGLPTSIGSTAASATISLTTCNGSAAIGRCSARSNGTAVWSGPGLAFRFPIRGR